MDSASQSALNTFYVLRVEISGHRSHTAGSYLITVYAINRGNLHCRTTKKRFISHIYFGTVYGTFYHFQSQFFLCQLNYRVASDGFQYTVCQSGSIRIPSFTMKKQLPGPSETLPASFKKIQVSYPFLKASRCPTRLFI